MAFFSRLPLLGRRADCTGFIAFHFCHREAKRSATVFSPFPFLTPAEEEEEEEEEAIEQPYIRLWRWQGGGEDSPIISGKCDVGICYFVGEWGESEIV